MDSESTTSASGIRGTRTHHPKIITLGAAPGSSESLATELVPTNVGPNVASRLTSLRHNVREDGFEPPTLGRVRYRCSTTELFPQEPSDGIEPPTNRLKPAALKPLSYEGIGGGATSDVQLALCAGFSGDASISV